MRKDLCFYTQSFQLKQSGLAKGLFTKLGKAALEAGEGALTALGRES